MIVDWSPVASAAITFAGVALPVIAAAVASFTVKHLHLQNNAVLSAQITDAATRGAGLAYQFLQANATAGTSTQLHNVAVAQGSNYVARSFPDALRAMGVNPEHIAEMVQGELGKLMANDAKPPAVVATGSPLGNAFASPIAPAPAASAVTIGTAA